MKRSLDIRFKIQGREGALSFLRGLADSLPVKTVARRRISMAIVEAFNNAVFHAHKGNKDIFVGVKIKKEGKDMVINIRDRGKGFDIGRIREPEIFNTKGRGIFIIKNIMKKVSYSNGRLVMIY